MSVFAVVLNEPNAEIEQRLRERYPNAFSLTDTFHLVQDQTITENITVNIGLKGDDRVEPARGVVFRLNGSYSGYTTRALWEWLEQAEEQEND